MKNTEVRGYYNNIAPIYDTDRFKNSYGKFIDKQERRYLEKHLKSNGKTLNLGCGTGRFMEYSDVGIDFSLEMLKVAEKKYPDLLFHCADAATTPFENNQFDQIICFHVFMHLTIEETAAIFREVNRILKPGGKFIFDYPSSERRKITKYKASNWHGANDFTKPEIEKLIHSQKWKTVHKKGVLFFPIHKFPNWLRKTVFPIDQLISTSFLKHYSSYLIHIIEKPKRD